MAPKIKRISAKTVGEAAGHILPYLEDTTSSTRYNIYYDGFPGLGNSAVLKCIAQEPPPTLMKKFGKIVHVDCSRWKSRRELQRTIAQQVQLPQGVMDIFDGKDEEDDLRGLDESSRAEIGDVSREILLALLDNKCLVVFHNGCKDIVELNDFGIPPAWFGTKVLWTGTGKPWRDPFPYMDSYEKLDDSHLYIDNRLSNLDEWKCLLQVEAREIARHTCKLGVTSEIAMECCLYLLSMMKHGYSSNKMDWDIHAYNYLVCDGIIPLPAGCQFDDQAWEVAAALHQYMGIQEAQTGTRHDALMTSQKRWICSIIHYRTTRMEDNVTVPQEATSFLFVKPYPPLATLPNNGMFHQSATMLRVLRLYGCTFSFSSPPFHCCRGLRFLGLDLCMDQDQPQGIDEEKDRVQKEVGFFQSLWVVDTSKTDWAPPEITEEMDTNIREIHIKKARFWLHNFQLHNLRKLRVIQPASPLEIHVLPRLPRLKTLILDGCVGLENVTGLPPSLETFSFSVGHDDAGRRDGAKITRISMPGCARMVDFTLRGSLPNLKQLNLSGTSIKTLDLSDDVVQAPRLERVILSGCHKLCAVLWPKEGTPCLSELYIDTRRGGGGEAGISFPDSDRLTYLQAYVGIMDMRFIQSLVQRTDEPRTVHSYGDRLVLLPSCSGFSWNKDTIKLNLCLSATRTGGPSYEAGPNYEYYRNLIRAALMRRHWDKQRPQLQAPRCHVDVVVDTVPKSLIPNNPFCRAYPDVITNDIAVDYSNYSSAPQLQPSRCHVDIGEGTINKQTDAESVHAINATIFLMNNAESLHVHDNSSITTVITEQMMSLAEEQLEWRHLKQCRVERCPKMHTVFATSYDIARFHELESLCAVDLSVAQCIWSKGMSTSENICSFAKLQSIHVYSCPKLTFVLPLSWSYNFTSLETIHIVSCGELRQVFPVEADYSRDHPKGVLKFPNLKHVYLHELNKLQHICEAKMFAPKLESVRLRGCWGLERLPSVVQGSRPVVDCEKDWWERLEWDGLEAGHDPSLFEPRHSLYYKMPLPGVSVLR